MKNPEIAAIFEEMAAILDIRGDNPFKVRAYRRAAINLRGLDRPVEELSRGELLAIPGIGEELAAKIGEYCTSGAMHAHERLKNEVPAGFLQLLAVPGLGPKTALHLVERAGITDLDALEKAALEHRLSGVPGIKARSEEKILKGIAALRREKGKKAEGAE